MLHMKKLPLLYTLILGAVFVSYTALFGTTVTTVPVGYISKTVSASADLKLGLPFKQPAAVAGSVESVDADTVTTTATVPDVTTAAHYLWVTSGTAVGSWTQVTASTTNTITVTDDLEALGVAAGNTYEIIPFWTLNTLFPDGAGFPVSSSVFAPSAFVLTNDVTAVGIVEGVNRAPTSTYFYHNGDQIPAGWYQNGALGSGLQNDVVLTPESYITVRNLSLTDADIVVSGTVPVTSIANSVVQRAGGSQDNQLPNPFPAGIPLQASGLISSGAISPSSSVFAPGDLILVFDEAPTGTNPAPDKVFFYHNGDQIPAAWYQNGALGSGAQNTYEIPAGGAVVIRKVGGSDALNTWSPVIPYNLGDGS